MKSILSIAALSICLSHTVWAKNYSCSAEQPYCPVGRTCDVDAGFCTATTASEEANRQTRGQAVYFNFMSYGTGIDTESLTLVNEWIEQANKREQVLEVTRKQHGREGEILVCTQLANSFLPSQFVKTIAANILEDRRETSHVRTSVRIGSGCSDYENATEQNLEAYSNRIE